MDNEQNILSLENLMIAAPCDVDWDDMSGDNSVRRCGDCKLNVYNVKSLTSKEVQRLLESELGQSGKLCVQLYRREDGTLLTADCPRGLRKIRALSSQIWRTVAGALAIIMTGSAVLAQDSGKAPAQPGTSTAKIPHRLMGKICPPKVLKDTNGSTVKAVPASNQTPIEVKKEDQAQTKGSEDDHSGKVHLTAFNLYKEGQQLEKSGEFAKAVEVYQKALTAMSKQPKHDPKFHLKIETALSRVKAKAGINQ